MKVRTVGPAEDQSYDVWKKEFTSHVEKNNGLYLLDERHYHDSTGMSQSSLKSILKSPKHFKHKQENPIKQNDAMQFGSAVHKLFFEPDSFNEYFVDVGSIDMRTKEGKAKLAKIEKDHPMAVHLKKEKMDAVRDCVKSLYNNELAMNFIGERDGVGVEIAAYGYLDERVLSRGKIDAIHWNRGMISDLKTTKEVTEYEFQRSTNNWKYHFQAAYYLDLFSAVTGKKFDKFAFVCAESSAPYDVQSYVCDPTLIEAGRAMYKDALDTYVRCRDNDSWPGFEQVVLNLTLPSWAN